MILIFNKLRHKTYITIVHLFKSYIASIIYDHQSYTLNAYIKYKHNHHHTTYSKIK